MVRLIVGNKGKGKTTEILAKANSSIKEATGSVVYLDKSCKHMYDLHRNIRLIDVSRFPIANSEQFVGFICGIISQDHDLEQIYLDSFLKIAKLEGADTASTLEQLARIAETYKVSIIVSVSLDADELPESVQKFIKVSL